MIARNDLLKKLSFFTEPGFKEELLQHGRLVSFNKGDVIVRDGQYVKFLPIVLKIAKFCPLKNIKMRLHLLRWPKGPGLKLQMQQTIKL